MAKDAYYFPHDSNAKDDPKCVMLIEELQLEGYGIYWILIETLREQPDFKYPMKLIPALARRYFTTKEKMTAVIKGYGLFEIEGDEFFHSESLLRRMEIVNEKREKAKLAGMKSGEARRLKAITANSTKKNVEQELNECSANVEQKMNNKRKEKEIKENKIKENKIKENNNKNIICVADEIPYKEIIEYLNYKTESAYKHTTPKTRDLIKTRFKEGFNINDFKRCIDNQTALWFKDPKMNKFLRPETLFGTKFESYVNNKVGLSDMGLVSQTTEKNMTVLESWARKKEMEEQINEE